MLDRFRARKPTQRLLEEELYTQVAAEIDGGDIRPGLWAKATADADGNAPKVKALYLKYRAQSIRDETELEEVSIEADRKKTAKSLKELLAEEKRVSKEVFLGFLPVRHSFFIRSAILVAAFSLAFHNTVMREYGGFSHVGDHPYHLVMGAIGASVGVFIFPLVHIAIASIWKSKRNNKSRKAIFLGWWVTMILLYALGLFAEIPKA